MKRVVFWMILALLLVDVFTLAFDVGLVRAQAQTVYINSDGSIGPSYAPISSVDNITYTFTGNISYPNYYGVVAERDNIVIDGEGYALQGNYNSSGTGLNLNSINSVTIKNTNIEGFLSGISLSDSNNNVISGNKVTANDYGIVLQGSSNNTVSWNEATVNSIDGISLSDSSNNTVSNNNVTANAYGLWLYSSSNNNIVTSNSASANNRIGIYLGESSSNTVCRNNVTANGIGILVGVSSYNTISWNDVTANDDTGICLGNSPNNIVGWNDVTANDADGISVESFSDNNTVSGNNATANSNNGIFIQYSSSITVSDNNASANNCGIVIWGSSDDVICGNSATANSRFVWGSSNNDGILLKSSSNNMIYHNNFIGNPVQASVDSDSFGNVWRDRYPSGGNFWSDYNGTGRYGIGDTPYFIDINNVDDYPLMGGFSDFNILHGVDVQVVSNSTVSDFQFIGTTILFNVSGVNGSTGFCNVCVPATLLNGTVRVLVNGTRVAYTLLHYSNSSVSYLYFTYGHSTEQVIIMPEFPEPLILASFMLATLLVIAIYKKRHSRSSARTNVQCDVSILMEQIAKQFHLQPLSTTSQLRKIRKNTVRTKSSELVKGFNLLLNM